MMTFRVVHKPSNNHVRCPYRIVEQSTGHEIDWINQYLDYEMLRRLADATLRTYPPQGDKGPNRLATVLSKQTLPQQALAKTLGLEQLRIAPRG